MDRTEKSDEAINPDQPAGRGSRAMPQAEPRAEPPAVPRGELAIRTLAMPGDANPNGDIFGGWVLSQMDIAGGITAFDRASGRVATVAVDAMTFHRPVYVGDVLCVYAEILTIGRTSITVQLEAWASRARRDDQETQRRADRREKVTEGLFTFVAIDRQGRPRPVPPRESP